MQCYAFVLHTSFLVSWILSVWKGDQQKFQNSDQISWGPWVSSPPSLSQPLSHPGMGSLRLETETWANDKHILLVIMKVMVFWYRSLARMAGFKAHALQGSNATHTEIFHIAIS